MRSVLIAALLAGCAHAAPPAVRALPSSVRVVTIEGTSMVPSAWPGDRAIITSTPYAQLVTGEIVLRQFDSMTQLVPHRITGGWSGHWITKGDSNERSDIGYLTPTNYRGTVVAVIQPGDKSYP